MCKNVPETVQLIKKSSNFEKKWTKLQTKVQKSFKVHFIWEILVTCMEEREINAISGRLLHNLGKLAYMGIFLSGKGPASECTRKVLDLGH